MELRILCKHLVADELNGKFTVGENNADTVEITLPRFYEQHDLSRFSFRITAAGKRENAAVQILETDSFDEKSVHLLWNVTSDFTSIPDEFTLVLTGVNDDNSVTIKFKSCPISVNTDKSWEFMPSPELSEQLFNQVQLEVQKAKEETKKANDAADRAEKASQTPAPAEIYPATEKRLGGIKSGGDVSVDDDGAVTVNAIKGKNPNTEIADIKSAQNAIASLSVQIAHPNNFLIYDNMGKPSVMVAVQKFYLDEVISGASHTLHPAFIVNGEVQDVIYISKYINIVENERAYSLPMQCPVTGITFDQAWNYCKAKGKGWHLMTNAEWAAIALWCNKNGTLPKGNNNLGKETTEYDLPQKAIAADYQSDGKIARTLTGSGPENWYHDGTYAGISDLNGNVWEWSSGVRLVNGEIQIIADNNAADCSNYIFSDGAMWKAVLPDGSLVSPGTSGTLKIDFSAPASSQTENFYLTDTLENYQVSAGVIGYKPFWSFTAKNGINVPQILKTLALFPENPDSSVKSVLSFSGGGEKLAVRGGRWLRGTGAGIFTIDLDNMRTHKSASIGFRSAYCGKL